MYAIEAKNISKTYRLYRKPIDRLKEALFRRPFHQSFESLSNVSFSIAFGDSIGIVGENGAGKSTLLKILAGTLTPSSGEVVINGRVTALLELGMGFHPEFSGRQNIYLNASLLGLTQGEIREKEPEIIDFAEIGAFIDSPIKTYSTGMVMRLAFSIATSVDPSTLIIDEALSVGDQYFQQKCIDKMLSLRREGKTILFCTHTMHLVNELCSHAIWLHKGAIQEMGIATRVTSMYTDFLRAKMDRGPQRPEAQPSASHPTDDSPTPSIFIKAITLNGETGPISLEYREDLHIVLEFESLEDRPFWVAMGIKRNDELLCHAVSMARDVPKPLQGKGTGSVQLTYRSLPLLYGQFSVMGYVFDESMLHCYHILNSSPITIVPPAQWRQEQGLLDLDHEWKILRDLK